MLRGTGLGVLEVSGGEDEAPVLRLNVQPDPDWHQVQGPLPLYGQQDLWLTWRGAGRVDLLSLYPGQGEEGSSPKADA